MSTVKHHKVVAVLPETLEPDALYAVRRGDGFDLYLTNHSGIVVAYPLNQVGTDSGSPMGILAEYTDGPNYGGYDDDNGFGSIAPFRASAIPGALPFNARGMILMVAYERYEGVTHTMLVRVTGSFPTVPFSGLSIDGGAPITGWTVYGPAGPESTTFRVSPLPGNPIPAGSHTIQFV